MPRLTPESELREWAARWSRAARAIDAIQLDELRRLKTPDAMAQLADAFEHALRHAEPRASSGLVDQQRLFALLRE
jgi:hypothetical protein